MTRSPPRSRPPGGGGRRRRDPGRRGHSECGRRSPGTRTRAIARPPPSRARSLSHPTRRCDSEGRHGCPPTRADAPARRPPPPPEALAAGTESRVGGRRLVPRRRREAARARRRTRPTRSPGRVRFRARTAVRSRARRGRRRRPARDPYRSSRRSPARRRSSRGPAPARWRQRPPRAGAASPSTAASRRPRSADRRRDPAGQGHARVSRSDGVTCVRPRSSDASSRSSVRGPMPGTSRSRPSAAARRSSAAVSISSAAPIRTPSSAPEPERAKERCKLRRGALLELVEVCDPAVVDQLPQPGLDAPADAAKLRDRSGPDECCDRKRRGPDQLGGSPEGTGGVLPGPGEVEEGRVFLECGGQLRVARLLTLHRRASGSGSQGFSS